jgi:SAM-dependent methyltransferase
MTKETLNAVRERLRPYVERSRGFSGWTPGVQQRRLGAPRPWNYMERAKVLVSASRSVLDLGTGGGERFADICAGYDGRAIATEEWVVNAPVAAERLGRLGVPVVRCAEAALPFRDERFDVVLNRHDELSPSEIARILKPGGIVLTEQVWRMWHEINAFFPRRADYGNHFHAYQDGFAAAGLELLDAREDVVPAAFESIGDLVYMLCILAPYDVPDFDPLGADLETLLALESAFTTPDGLVLTDGRYIIEARKPAS